MPLLSAIVPGSIDECLPQDYVFQLMGVYILLGSFGSSMILAEFAIAGGTLTIKGVCRYLRNRDNAFKDPGDVQLLGTASKYSANGFQLRISTAESRHLWYVEYR